MRTCCTAAVVFVESVSVTAPAAATAGAASAQPVNTREARYLRIAVFLTSAVVSSSMPRRHREKRQPTTQVSSDREQKLFCRGTTLELGVKLIGHLVVNAAA